ncbi:MAG: dTDP-glucose 4,6-dehydratase [Bacteroidota bacterium]|nr:dTDP-glucose 4,6-dehydratase [Bacteroidota bacterium]MDP4233648.1 dTDP-glucose 4,6-dehydratase [Bacteroidota bacterium]MDP4243092.1 dTDP-glucose 4,6-dehydratase [Bacteroidota bacterium]MDP4288462.1 dTDP-glucose 4,6-dehydratase [Bacteroidota bacterium]
MVLLLTGAAGFIGANFAHLATARGHRVVIYDALTYAGNPKNIEGIGTFVKGDIRDASAVARVLETKVIPGFAAGGHHAFDAIINFAAESHVDRSIASATPFVETNVLGAVTMLEMGRTHGVPLFVQISTDEVYGSIEGTAKSTFSSPLNPSSAYSASKASADLLLLSYHHTHGMDVRVTRCTNNYGRFQHPEKFIPTILRCALTGEPIPVYGDGRQVRDWIHVDDHCEGIWSVIERGEAGGIYHFGGPGMEGNDIAHDAGVENISLIHLLLRILAERTGRKLSELTALIQHVSDRPGHDRRYSLDWEDSRRGLGWQPQVTLEDGLRQTVDWWLANQDWWSGV